MHALSPAAGVQAPPDELEVDELVLDELPAPLVTVHACAQGPLFSVHAPRVFVALSGWPHMLRHLTSPFMPGFAGRQVDQHWQLVSLSHPT